MSAINKYTDLMEKVYKALDKAEVLKDFRRALLCRAEWASRDLSIVTENDDRSSIYLRGQIGLCFELADGAKDALERKNGEANPSIEQEIPLDSL